MIWDEFLKKNNLHVGRQMALAFLVGRHSMGDSNLPDFTSPKAKRWYEFYAQAYAQDNLADVPILAQAYASWVIMETTSREIDPKDATTLCEVDNG